jgi:hypothetical protein
MKLALALALLSAGCSRAWVAATYPQYFAVERLGGPVNGVPLPDGDVWLCRRVPGEAILVCGEPEQVWACPIGGGK